MKYFLIAICIFYSVACTSQSKNIYGIYFSHYSYYGEANSILRLDSNNTFHYYENLDEGDVASECLSSGMFSIVGDSLFFESLYDSSYNVGYTKNIYFVNFADTKMRISNSGLQASNLPKIARPNAEMRSFYKLDFLELDSIKIRAFTISTIEDLLITKNNVASLSSTKIDGIKTFYIANTKYQHLLSRLQKINLFSLTHKNIVDGAVVAGSVELFMGKNHIYVSGNYFSQELYDLLFREVLADQFDHPLIKVLTGISLFTTFILSLGGLVVLLKIPFFKLHFYQAVLMPRRYGKFKRRLYQILPNEN